jgi:hypothetical protein
MVLKNFVTILIIKILNTNIISITPPKCEDLLKPMNNRNPFKVEMFLITIDPKFNL